MVMTKAEFQAKMENAKTRLGKWWSREKADRPLFVMHTCKNPPDPQTFFTGLDDSWLNIDKRLEFEELKMEHTIFHGENYPGVNASLGPGSLALFLGSKPLFEWDTIWYLPCFDDLRSASIKLDPLSKYWQWTIEYTKRAIERSKGRYLVELPDFIENFDTLASLFGAENLLMGVLDYPEEIHRLQEELLAAWFLAFEEIYSLIREPDGGMSVGYFNLWAPGRVAKLQCDISATISAKTFEEFVAPYLNRQAEKLDYALYHLDGPNALQHADIILGMDSIDAVQWQPGSAYPEAIDPMWYSLQQRILDTGKSIMIFVKPGDPDTLCERLERFVKTVGKDGVMFVIEQNLEDEKIAYDILNKSYLW